MSWLSRIFTLPAKYNSLSDIGKDPLGAIGSAAQTAATAAPLFGVPLPTWVTQAAQIAGLAQSLQAANAVRGDAYSALKRMSSGNLPAEARTTLALQEQIIKQLMQMAMQMTVANIPARAKTAYLQALAQQMRQIQGMGKMANMPGVAASLRLQAIQNALQAAQQEQQRLQSENLQRQALALQALQAAAAAQSPSLAAIGNIYGTQADAARSLAQFAAQMYNPEAVQAGLANLFASLMRRQQSTTQPKTAGGLNSQPTTTITANDVLAVLRGSANTNNWLPLPNIRVR